MGLVLKICGNEWQTASRDKRELSVYRDLGNEVLVMAKGNPEDSGREDIVDGFKVLRYSTRPLGSRVPNSVNRLFSLFQWAISARKLKPNIISGHDLMPGLTIAWLSTLFQNPKPLLVYDAHEFELGRNAGGNRGAFERWFLKHEEKFLMKRCAFSIMVNDSIADEVQRIYNLKKRPIVVRSTPYYWLINEQSCEEKRQAFLDSFLTFNNDVDFLMMYHGALTSNRGIERLIEAVKKIDGVGLVILGTGEEKYVASLHKLVKASGVEHKVLFHPAVRLAELWKYVGAVDVSVAPIEVVSKNHYFSLPNKFFESIQSMTPIIASDVPEMKRIIDKYQIGMTCKAGDVDDLCRCVRKMREDKKYYQKCKENLKIAKEELCWEKEKIKLIEAFRENYLNL